MSAKPQGRQKPQRAVFDTHGSGISACGSCSKATTKSKRREAAMDVAWKLGVGSPANDWELRMSMRSFWSHYRAQANYWIIGHIPAWIDTREVFCLPWPDPYRRCKDANLLHKAIRLAMEPELSDPFIWCSDDQILLRPSAPEDFRLWHTGEISEERDDDLNKWQLRMINTGVRLRRAGYPALNFDSHVPHPMHKDWVKEALRFDFSVKPGMCVSSTIVNCSREPGLPLDSEPVRAWLGNVDFPKREVDALLSKCQFASLAEKSLDNHYFVSKLKKLFPDAAPWELDAAKSSRHPVCCS
jgi:hypothetical protein